MSTSLARRERLALCDLVLAVGPDAPTLCGGWTTRDLVAHLLVRERDPLAAAGLQVRALAGLTDRAMRRVSRRDWPVLVESLRSPGLTPFALPTVEVLANTLEYLVHHEDVRRAAPGWTPRTLPGADHQTVWSALGRLGSLPLRRVGVPVVLAWAEREVRHVVRGGDEPAVVRGDPVELALWAFGRSELSGVALDGPASRVRALEASVRGL